MGDFTSLTLLAVDAAAPASVRGAGAPPAGAALGRPRPPPGQRRARAARAGAPRRAARRPAAGGLRQHARDQAAAGRRPPGSRRRRPALGLQPRQTPQVWLDPQVSEERRRAGLELGRGRGALPGRRAGRHVRGLQPLVERLATRRRLAGAARAALAGGQLALRAGGQRHGGAGSGGIAPRAFWRRAARPPGRPAVIGDAADARPTASSPPLARRSPPAAAAGRAARTASSPS